MLARGLLRLGPESWELQTSNQEPRQRSFSALRNRNFALLWGGTIVSNATSWMQIVAQGWLIYNLTGSAVDLGIVGVARSVPILALTTMGGVIADRASRLLILRAAQSFNVVLSLALAVMVALDAVNVWILVAFAFLAGTSTAFEQPARGRCRARP